MNAASERLFALTANIAGQKANAVIDSGANRSYASIELGEKLRRYKKRKEYPYPLTMADGSPVEHGDGWIREELRDILMDINEH